MQSSNPNENPTNPSELVQGWIRYKNGEISHDDFDQLVLDREAASVGLNATNDAPSSDLLWKQYELHVDLYKHLLELTLKFNGFYWVGTGAVLSFYFSKSNEPMIKYALLFPVLVSVLLVPFFASGVVLLNVTRKHIYNLSARMGLYIAPEINVLGALLASTAFLLIIVAGSLLWFFFPNLIWVAVLILALTWVFLWLLFRDW
ncbi:MAG TPA: hypothetical protein VJV21_01170 [Pyrinomonadaceae bacterium]|nr:hypothetical protein [Pyrinomonadaceae bacterium]